MDAGGKRGGAGGDGRAPAGGEGRALAAGVLAVALAMAIAVAAGGAGSAQEPALAQAGGGSERPNVIVVMTDDQHPSTIEAMPNVRRLLIERGTTFVNGYASYPRCCPSRATFLTGQHAHNHGVEANIPGYPDLDAANTLPVWLARAGYMTAHVGKFLNGYGVPRGRPMTPHEARVEVPPGWRRWFAGVRKGKLRPARMYRYMLNQNGNLVRYGKRARAYQTDVLARHATRLVRRFAGGDEPLFLSLATSVPHQEPNRRNRKGPDPRPAPRHRGQFRDTPLPRPPSFNHLDRFKHPRVSDRPPLTRENRRQMLRRYRGQVGSLQAVDEAVAGIVRELRRARQLRNTLIVFTSDQGWMQGEHRLAGGKDWPYEETIGVPLILRGPGLGVPAGVEREQIASNVDLAPTILAATGVEPGLEQDGLSLLRLARNPRAAADRAILLEHLDPDLPRWAGVRAPAWAYVRYDDGSEIEELYDLDRDPHQLENLLHDSPDPTAVPKRAQLANLLVQLRDCAGAACVRSLPR